jgi:hypothetical protein
MSSSPNRRSPPLRTKAARVGRCAICGSTRAVEEHHIGGRNHAAYFTIPLCRPHHTAVTIAIAQARIDSQYTSDMPERARRARQAAYIFLWFLDEAIQPNQENKIDRFRS